MSWRHQLPVYSPLPFRAVVSALAGEDRREALALELREEYTAAAVMLTSSGTAALTLALRIAAERRPGAAIAMPAYACYDLVSAAMGAGVPVVLYDLDPETLQPDADSLRRALAPGAAALVVAHLFGLPVAMDAMREAARTAGALLVEDAAQGTGGRFRDLPLGATGDIGILSFGRGKGETGGGGGALLLKDSALLTPAVRGSLEAGSRGRLPFAARLAAQWMLGRPSLYAIPRALPFLRLGETIFRPPVAPATLPPASASTLGVTRPLAAAEGERRRGSAARLLGALGGRRGALAFAVPAGGVPGWLRLPLRLPGEAADHPHAAALGIARGYPRPLHELEQWQSLLTRSGQFAGASTLARQLITLPTHGLLAEPDLRRLEAWLGEVLLAHHSPS